MTENNEQVSKKYVKLSPREHVLAKPGMYVGSVELDTYNTWIFNIEDKSINKSEIKITPGLFKIFDEILVNCLDHIERLKQKKDSETNHVKEIKVNIDNNSISITNSGDGIDIIKHSEHNMYIPELIFGNLLTSTNYDENVEKTIGGTFGIGSKAVNIYSTKFIIETVDSERSLYYYQEFSDNMSNKTEPIIKKYKKYPFTKITFIPDYQRFNIEELDNDILSLFYKRVYDIAGLTDNTIKVYLNDEKINISNFEKYIDLYTKDNKKIYDKVNNRWEIAVAYNEGLEQVSFVNGICTMKGGKHVDNVVNNLCKSLIEALQKKYKDITFKPAHIKDNLFIFINCTIVNPSFDSQTKDCLTTPVSKFGSKCEFTKQFITKILNSELAEKIYESATNSTSKSLKKTDGKKLSKIRGIPQLNDANWAGTNKSKECSLILTEGLSAASMAISGLSVVGRDKFGVFPLKGKILNTLDTSEQKIADNTEITALKKIMGLESKKKYKNTNDLRYGSIMILTDQDSVVANTPILLQDIEKNTIIESIENINNIWHSINDKEYGICPYKVWTQYGWSSIIKIIRHKVSKRIFRVITNTGIVDVTEDHSLIDRFGKKITPKECTIGFELLHGYPKLFDFDNIKSKYTCLLENVSNNITIDINGKLEAAKLFYLAKSMDFNVYTNMYDKYKDVITLHITKEDIINKSKIIDIVDLGITEQYVYDLETENHQFQAGVGKLIVHNTDGSHIKGLLFNMFNSMWPTLITQENFLTSMLTPIIKAKKNKKIVQFYNLTDYDNWKNKNEGKNWDIKYYKGLGTSTTIEAKEYFKDMKQVFYMWDDDKESKEYLDLAFNKKRADDRKQWLYNYDRNEILDYKETQVSYSDFIKKDLIHFSNYNLERSIPSLCDGLKTSTRKIIYCCFKKNLTKEIKVSQLSGYCSENSNYHHGEVSLQEAIIKMAQNFVGSNNINLLMPNGQFGSRLAAKDAASPRYIFTELNPLTLLLFNKFDNKILNYLNDDGFPIEPQFYIPILPVILINGSIGIATGFSTNIPSYNPLDIIRIIKTMLKNKTSDIEIDDIIPWYRGFTGKIIKINDKLMSLGNFKRISPNKIQITELPVGFWTNEYKEFLEKYIDKNPKVLKDFESHYTESTIDFILDFYDGKTNDLLKIDNKTGLTKFEKEFKLFSSDNFSTSNMHMYNDEGKIIKCSSAIEIIKLFYNIRIKYYQIRKDFMINELNNELLYLDAKIKFILDIINKKLIVTDRKKIDIEQYLIDNHFPLLDNKYDYLIRMPIYNLTFEKKEELLKEVNNKKDLLENITNTTIENMWSQDINDFEKQYKIIYKTS